MIEEKYGQNSTSHLLDLNGTEVSWIIKLGFYSMWSGSSVQIHLLYRFHGKAEVSGLLCSVGTSVVAVLRISLSARKLALTPDYKKKKRRRL